ncbi:hypothetical protein DPMN_168477 [Dreissena polymorpha]|uniref:Uncharacterized protein n=1 Tax=Dreissena polymorpha TaxID=45954 RepID=A0A9D4IVY9_DREPO|nr:hypothetical protein DPMN_168477 [Dreissena polymorpha]
MYIITFSIEPTTSSASSFSCSKAGTMCSHGKYGKDISFLKKRNLSPFAAYAVARHSFTTFRYTR